MKTQYTLALLALATLIITTATTADGYSVGLRTKTASLAVAETAASLSNFNATGSGTITANLIQEIQRIETQINLQYTPPQDEGQQATLSGRLTLANDSTVGVANKPVILSYFDAGWQTITNVTTDADGGYSYDWTLPQDLEAGPLPMKASFEGDPEGTSPQYLACDSVAIGNPLLLLPEYALGGLVALTACFAAFAVFKLHKKPRKL
jgi:hypothetical protein